MTSKMDLDLKMELERRIRKYRAEGVSEIFIEVFVESFTEGYEGAYEETKKVATTIAQAMIQHGLSTELIAECTHLSLDDVQKLLDKQNQ